jgi:glycosyltransferase involved in cell wall biosynthesis
VLVSVVVGNFNYGRFVREAITSVLEQTYPNVEIIVIDDGSTDNSRDVIDTFGEKLRKVYIPNGGQSNVFDLGLRLSRGEIVCMLDSDDFFYPNKIQRVVEMYAKMPDAHYVFHAVSRIEGERTYPGPESINAESRMIGKNITRVFTAPPTTGTTYRRSLLERIFPIPSVAPMGADNFTKFAAMSLERGYYSTEALGVLRIHGSNHGSMGMPIAKRLNHDTAIALALHQKFPQFDCIERLMAIAYSRAWIVKPDDSTIAMLNEYRASLSTVQRLRLFLLASLFYVKRRTSGNVN